MRVKEKINHEELIENSTKLSDSSPTNLDSNPQRGVVEAKGRSFISGNKNNLIKKRYSKWRLI